MVKQRIDASQWSKGQLVKINGVEHEVLASPTARDEALYVGIRTDKGTGWHSCRSVPVEEVDG